MQAITRRALEGDMTIPQVFVSHNHNDNDYCRAFVAALRQGLGDDKDAVWYDEHNLGWGSLRQVIQDELRKRQHFIVILSPTAVDSEWVNNEIDAALTLRRRKSMLTVQFVLAMPCEVPLLLEHYKRIEQPGGLPFPPTEAAMRALAVITGVHGEQQLIPLQPHVTLPPLGPAPMPINSIPALHLTSERLYNLGYRGYSIGMLECILPPICPVPAGEFRMGSDRNVDSETQANEQPQEVVYIPAFSMSRFPVTVAEYACYVSAGYSMSQDWQDQLMRRDHPVVYVSWNAALLYTTWLSSLTGQNWRLPTEAEWEKAARGTDSRIYPWGNTFDQTRANTSETETQTTTAVGSYPHSESPYYVQDMAGNVWEWTSSLYKPYPYNANDGREVEKTTENRVLRGGSWGSNALVTRTAYRYSDVPNAVHVINGFRLVLVPADS